MTTEKKHRIYENLIYALIWLIVFAMPAIGSLSWDNTLSWDRVFKQWLFVLPALLLFLLNNYILFPLLFNRKKYWYYVVCLIAALVVYMAINPMTTNTFNKNSKFDKIPQNELRPPQNRDSDKIDFPPFDGPKPDKPAMRPPGPRPNDFMLPRPLFRPTVTLLIIAILIIGLNFAIKLLFKTIKDDNVLKDLEQQNLRTELENLKNQINPHFFMNTLNNIHSLIDIDSEKAKESIISLSKIMRYVLYDCSSDTVPLEKEIVFLNNYIELMEMRYTDNVKITLCTPVVSPSVQISPLLFVSFIENAFTHGISYREPSFVTVGIEVTDTELKYYVENSIPKDETNKGNKPQGGIGLENSRKRLNLLYGNQYSLNVTKADNVYKVILTIPLA